MGRGFPGDTPSADITSGWPVKSMAIDTLYRVLLALSAFCILRASLVQGCTEERILATARNTTLGVEVALFRESDGTQLVNPLAILDHYLSSECGPLNRRCQELFVSSVNESQFIVFIPLDDGILLVDVRRNNGTQLAISGHHIIDVAAAGCSPVASFLVLNADIFCVCVDQAKRYVTVLQIYLDHSALQLTGVNGPLIDFRALEEPPRLSDFEFISLGPTSFSSQRIFFSTGGLLYALVPESYLHYFMGELSCSAAQSLVSVGDDTLIAYCNESAVYFDIVGEVQLNSSVYSDPMGGQPLVCSDRDVHMVVRQTGSGHYCEYGRWSVNSRRNVNLQGSSFQSGVCFGVGDASLLAYVDKAEGVFVQELFTDDSSLHQLSSSPCPPTECEPLRVFQERYIVIRGYQGNDPFTHVVDARNLSSPPLIAAEHASADLLAVLVAPCPASSPSTATPEATSAPQPTPSPSTATPRETTTLPPLVINDLSVAAMVGISIGGAIAGIAVAAAGILTLLVLVMIRRRNAVAESATTPVAESSGSTTASGAVDRSLTEPPSNSDRPVNLPQQDTQDANKHVGNTALDMSTPALQQVQAQLRQQPNITSGPVLVEEPAQEEDRQVLSNIFDSPQPAAFLNPASSHVEIELSELLAYEGVSAGASSRALTPLSDTPPPPMEVTAAITITTPTLMSIADTTPTLQPYPEATPTLQPYPAAANAMPTLQPYPAAANATPTLQPYPAAANAMPTPWTYPAVADATPTLTFHSSDAQPTPKPYQPTMHATPTSKPHPHGEATMCATPTSKPHPRGEATLGYTTGEESDDEGEGEGEGVEEEEAAHSGDQLISGKSNPIPRRSAIKDIGRRLRRKRKERRQPPPDKAAADLRNLENTIVEEELEDYRKV